MNDTENKKHNETQHDELLYTENITTQLKLKLETWHTNYS